MTAGARSTRSWDPQPTLLVQRWGRGRGGPLVSWKTRPGSIVSPACTNVMLLSRRIAPRATHLLQKASLDGRQWETNGPSSV